MSKATDARRELDLALEKWQPNCADSELFTRDDLEPADLAVMRTVCKTCPIWPECFTFAAATRPLAGFWAGHASSYYRTKKGLTA